MTGNKHDAKIGDWVKGKTKEGELLHGFVEFAEPAEGWVKVRVVNCDNEETVGKTVETFFQWVEKLPDASKNEEQILQLVDLALRTRDEAWFRELLYQFNQLKQGQPRKKYKWDPAFSNRLRRLEIRE